MFDEMASSALAAGGRESPSVEAAIRSIAAPAGAPNTSEYEYARRTYLEGQLARASQIAAWDSAQARESLGAAAATLEKTYKDRAELADAMAWVDLEKRAESHALRMLQTGNQTGAGASGTTAASSASKQGDVHARTVKDAASVPMDIGVKRKPRARKRAGGAAAAAAAAAGAGDGNVKIAPAPSGPDERTNGHAEPTTTKRTRKRKADNGVDARGRSKFRAVPNGETKAKRKDAAAAAGESDAGESAVGGSSAGAATDASTEEGSVSSVAGGPLAPKRSQKQYNSAYDGIWRDIARKDLPKAYKIYQSALNVKLSNTRKTAALTSREAKRWQIRTNKQTKDLQSKARRAMREMMAFWKRNEREERDQRRKAEKEALEAARRLEEERESRRQARKLNFLITQTELYSHFIGHKIKTDEIEGADGAGAGGAAGQDAGGSEKKVVDLENASVGEAAHHSSLDFDAADDEHLSRTAQANAQQAVMAARARAHEFDEQQVRKVDIDDSEMNFQNPTSLGDLSIAQPKLLTCELKEYQLKGLNWLANLYEQGINGILADEMGLGKTVQSISVMAYLAETHNIWGPFLVIAPASTLHNWQQEISKFVPAFKVLPYWGNNKDRKVLRKFWDRKQLRYTKDSPFHVLVTSYQLVVSDAQYFNRIKWQYMILDEAQAIKSSSSSRWKSLLSMQCRNRLLLTGTPIQNSMQELWALLHFIMPTLFDSHEEFSDWFSKDIESHATKNSQLNEQQLKRLHMILKPFMLRRVKKHVQQELGDKIEIDEYCDLTGRQKQMYQQLRSQISLRDLLERTANDDTQSLMNLVMQFRKVCNHPDLFERSDTRSAFSFSSYGASGKLSRPGAEVDVDSTQRNEIAYELPKLVYREGLLDVPNEHSNEFVKRKLERMLTVWDPQSASIKAWEKIANTPAADIVREARKGLFERALGRYEPEAEQTYQPALIEGLRLDRVGPQYLEDSYLKVYDRGFQEPALAPPIASITSDRAAYVDQQQQLFPTEKQALQPLTLGQEWSCLQKGHLPPSNLYPPGDYTTIVPPSMPQFIAESGKLARLDSLLAELKAGDHRVLIYFQMTKMMDLMEEYLAYKHYQYCRLDGSSKLSDRRDLVNDWQTKPELFVFLLSTRAGGLGINLTAADTVIFYDSDWNPTIDSQAMDRAHRLGQTRQVTVYRLLVRGTIEERMRDRAKQKEQVQKVVMEGRGQQADFQKPGREVAYWLLDDDKAVNEALQQQEQLENAKPRKKGKKAKPKQASLEDMYHEQEGNFEDS